MGLDNWLTDKVSDLFPEKVCAHAVHHKGSGSWDNFWEEVVVGPKKGTGACFVLDMFENTDLNVSTHLEVPDGVTRTVVLRFGGKISGNMSVSVKLGKKSSFGCSVLGILKENDTLSLDINSEQDAADSQFWEKGRIVCTEGSSLKIMTHGIVGEDSESSRCVFDTKVLRIGEVTSVEGMPEIEVMRDDVVADHGLTIGGVDDEVALYMKSRGVTQSEVEKLYVKGFLKGSCGLSGS